MMDKNYYMKEAQDQFLIIINHEPLEVPGFLNAAAKVIQFLLSYCLAYG